MTYKISKQGKIFLICNEGICLSPYLDSVGVKTIAIGATSSDIKDLSTMPWETTITMQTALNLLDTSLIKYEDAINQVLDAKVSLLQNQYDALVSITYNIGTGRVRARQGGMAGSTFMRLINTNAPHGLLLDINIFQEIWGALWRTPDVVPEAQPEPPAPKGWDTDTVVNAIMMWNKPSEIIGRRRREARLFSVGNYGDGKANVFPVNVHTHKPNYSGGKLVDVNQLLDGTN